MGQPEGPEPLGYIAVVQLVHGMAATERGIAFEGRQGFATENNTCAEHY